MTQSITDYGGSQLLSYCLTASPVTRPSSWFAALHNGNPSQTGQLNELGAGIGYSRQAISFSAPVVTTRQCLNLGILQWGPASGAGFGTVNYISIWDAVSGGNSWWYGPITSQIVVAGDSYTLLAGLLSITFPPTPLP